MAHDDVLAGRVRAALERALRVEERRMFGGIVFMVDGKMCVCVGRDRLMCRIDPNLHDAALKDPGCRTVVMKGRRYRGYVYVEAGVVRTKRDLQRWIDLALDYNRTASTASRRGATPLSHRTRVRNGPLSGRLREIRSY